MQKLFAISCSFLILLQSVNISFEDISKINVLVEHAQYHKDSYGDSFLEFLAEHYGETNLERDTEHKEHEGLPFKHHHKSCTHSLVAFTFKTHEFNLDYKSFSEIPLNFFYKESTSLFEKPSIFQPPKHA